MGGWVPVYDARLAAESRIAFISLKDNSTSGTLRPTAHSNTFCTGHLLPQIRAVLGLKTWFSQM